jgi:hypothetical protein
VPHYERVTSRLKSLSKALRAGRRPMSTPSRSRDSKRLKASTNVKR